MNPRRGNLNRSRHAFSLSGTTHFSCVAPFRRRVSGASLECGEGDRAPGQTARPAGSGQLVAVLDGEPDEGVAAVNTEFMADAVAVILDRAVADEKLPRDLFTRLVLGYEFQDAPLCGRQSFQTRRLPAGRIPARGAVDEVAGDGRADVVLAGGDGPDARDDVADGAVLEEVPQRADSPSSPKPRRVPPASRAPDTKPLPLSSIVTSSSVAPRLTVTHASPAPECFRTLLIPSCTMR